MDTALHDWTAPAVGGVNGFMPAALWRMLSPELARLAECPRFVSAASMDFWLEANRPWWEPPDLLGKEAEAWAVLMGAAPELAEFALPIPTGMPTEEEKYLQRCRWAAIRTCAGAVGIVTTTYQLHPQLGADAALSILVAQGLTMRIGKVVDCHAQATPSQIEEACALLREPKVLPLLETIFCPFAGDPKNFSANFARWSAFAPLRAWQAEHRMPLISKGTKTSVGIRGYSVRYLPADVSAAGIPFETLAGLVAPLAAHCLGDLRLHPLLASEMLPALELIDWALERRRAAAC